MKNALILVTLLSGIFQLTAREKIEIPARQSVELTYAEFADFDVELINRSGKNVNVTVLDPNTGGQVSGFGMGAMTNIVLYVAEGHILKLKNTSYSTISITLKFVERKPQSHTQTSKETVSFTLHNSSLRSIPLIIPGVMNPNLSPLSNSGVVLETGQQIFFRQDGKKMLLLTVDENVKNGEKIDVPKRIRDLKKDK